MPNDSQQSNSSSSNSSHNSLKGKDTSKTKKAATWIPFLLLLSGVGLVFESFYQEITPIETQVELGSNQHFVSHDIEQLSKAKKLPKPFYQLQNITWAYYDEELKKQIPKDALLLKTTPHGLYNLEVSAFSSSKEDSKIAILQMSLIEIKSGNKILEMSRNYEIPKKNQQ